MLWWCRFRWWLCLDRSCVIVEVVGVVGAVVMALMGASGSWVCLSFLVVVVSQKIDKIK